MADRTGPLVHRVCRGLLLLSLGLGAPPGTAWSDDSVVLMKPVTIEMTAEALQDLELELPLSGDLLYKAEFLPADPPSEDLVVGFFAPQSKSDPRAVETSDLVRPGGVLHLRVLAERCCSSGTYQRTVELIPQQGTAWPIHLPVHVTVEGSSLTCHLPAASFFLVFAVGVLLNLYAYGMAANSHFVPLPRLAARLRPLQRNGAGGLEEGSRKAVEALVRRDLPFWRRALNWLRANPLVFGLPGGSFHETIELQLHPRRDVSVSRLCLIPHRNFHKTLQQQPQLGQGRLFAAAFSQLRFFAVPHRGKVGELMVKDASEEAGQPELTWIGPNQDLLRNMEGEDRPVVYAGWRIGG
jgi:hypothetical protein